MCFFPKRMSNDSGFTLASAVAGMGILLFSLFALASVFLLVNRTLHANRILLTASGISRSFAEEARFMDYDDVGTIGGNPPGVFAHSITQTVDNIDFRIEPRVWWVEDTFSGDMTAYKKLEIRVWAPAIFGSGVKQYVSHGTYVSFEGEKKLEEGGNIKVTALWGDRGEFQRDLSVSITGESSGISQSGWTDNLGIKIFGELEEGTYIVTADPSSLGMMHRPVGAVSIDEDTYDWEFDDTKSIVVLEYQTSHCFFSVDWPLYIGLEMVDSFGDVVSPSLYPGGLVFEIKPSGITPAYFVRRLLSSSSDVDLLEDIGIWPGWDYDLSISDKNIPDNKFYIGDWDRMVSLPVSGAEVRSSTLEVKLAVDWATLPAEGSDISAGDKVEIIALDAEGDPIPVGGDDGIRIFYRTDGIDPVPGGEGTQEFEPGENDTWPEVGADGLNLKIIGQKDGLLWTDIEEIVF